MLDWTSQVIPAQETRDALMVPVNVRVVPDTAPIE